MALEDASGRNAETFLLALDGSISSGAIIASSVLLSRALQPIENIIERAFQLAAESGSVDEVQRKLMREGFFQVQAHLAGRQLRSEIQRRLNPELVAARKA